MKLFNIIIFCTCLASTNLNGQSGYEIEAFPNPAIDTLNVQINNLAYHDTVTIQLFNRWGEKIPSGISDSVVENENFLLIFEVESLPEDSYLLRVEINNTKSQKMIGKVSNSTNEISNKAHHEKRPFVFPVPFSKSITIENVKKISYIEIFDIQGKSIIKIDSPLKNTINLSNLPVGEYIIKISIKKNIYTYQIVKTY